MAYPKAFPLPARHGGIVSKTSTETSNVEDSIHHESGPSTLLFPRQRNRWASHMSSSCLILELQYSIRHPTFRPGRKAVLLTCIPGRPQSSCCQVPKLLNQFQPRKRNRYAFVAVLTSTPPSDTRLTFLLSRRITVDTSFR